MKPLSDSAVDRLRHVADLPDVGSTRYTILEPLGRGGMATVYLARDNELERDVALKVVDSVDSGPDATARMLREARVMATLEHPGIVPVHDAGTLADGRVYCAMKRVSGDRLDEIVRAGASLAEKLRIFLRVGEAVSFCHAHGVIHRDLKPSNIMVGSFGEVLVMDWGLAKLPSAAETEGTVLGTPGFMAPEQARGETAAVDERSDVYALGAILEFLLAEGPPMKPLRAAARKARAERPEDRYASAAALMADVQRFLEGQPVSAYPENVLERAGRVLNRYRLAAGLIVAYLVMRLVFLLWTRSN